MGGQYWTSTKKRKIKMTTEIVKKLNEIFSAKTLNGRVQVVDMSELVDKQIVKESTNIVTDYT